MLVLSFLYYLGVLFTFVQRGCAAATLSRATDPTFFIAGDSTAAKDDGSPELLGWGEKIGQYISIAVVNNAVSGATTRTYTEQGYCTYFRIPRMYHG